MTLCCPRCGSDSVTECGVATAFVLRSNDSIGERMDVEDWDEWVRTISLHCDSCGYEEETSNSKDWRFTLAERIDDERYELADPDRRL